ncbi:MAG: T9SS type A sorting domain-containing protein, partial [Cytophagales bacterium]|nr:T9SS type A sorting domain-containing protein [Cytophagales bacterium]
VNVGANVTITEISQPEYYPVVFDFKFDHLGVPFLLALPESFYSDYGYVYKYDGSNWTTVGSKFNSRSFRNAKLAFNSSNSLFVAGTVNEENAVGSQDFFYCNYLNGQWISPRISYGERDFNNAMANLWDVFFDDNDVLYFNHNNIGRNNILSKIENNIWSSVGRVSGGFIYKSRSFYIGGKIYVFNYDTYNSQFNQLSGSGWIAAAPNVSTSNPGGRATAFGIDNNGIFYSGGYQSIGNSQNPYILSSFSNNKWNPICPEFPVKNPNLVGENTSFEIDNAGIIYFIGDGKVFKFTPAVLPSTPLLNASPLTFCSNTPSPVTINVTGQLNDARGWFLYSGACGGTFVASTTGNSFTINPTRTTTYYVRGEGICNTIGQCGTPITVTVNNVPPIPNSINGQNAVCAGSTFDYSVPSVSGATGYVWIVPSDALIVSGQGTSTIRVTWGTKSGNLQVSALNSCGASAQITFPVNVSSAPIIATPISGPTTVCKNTIVTYSLSNVPGANSYNWSVPVDARILSGQNSNSISVLWGQTDGMVNVTANNSCGVSPAVSLTVTKNEIPATPSVISGSNLVCPSSSSLYSVPLVAGATQYFWSVPAGATILSGQNTNSINVHFGANAGNVGVIASNVCGQSSPYNLAISLKLNTQIQTQPQDKSICSDGMATLGVVASGTNLSYRWSTGAVSSNIVINNSGQYNVVVTGDCGAVTSRTAIVSVLPTTQITQQPTSKSVCPGGSASLSVQATGNNLSYLWTNGATTPTISVTQGGAYSVRVSGTCGVVNSNSVTLTIQPTTQIVNDPSCNYVLFCADKSANLSVNAIGANLTYLWSNGATTPVLTTNASGCYFVQVSGLCGPPVTSKPITAVALPIRTFPQGYESTPGYTTEPGFCYQIPPVSTEITGPTQICSNQTVSNQIYTAPTINTPGATYTWWVNGAASVQSIPGQPNKASITFSQWFGSGSVHVGVNLPVSPWYQTYSLNVNSASCNGRLSDETEEATYANIFPNPYENTSTISLIGATNSLFSIKIQDNKGVVLSTYENISGGTQLEVGKNLAAGLYMVTITKDGVTKSYKLVRLP